MKRLALTAAALLNELRGRYQIPAANVIGHGDIAPRRKTDPSRYFPWKRLAEQGLGLWCEPPQSPAQPGMDFINALRALGYDVSDPAAAVAAFRRHFMNEESMDPVPSEEEKSVLQCLLAARRP